MPPRIWRRAFHEAYRADEGIDDAGVVAHAGNRAQALVQGVGILAGQLPRLLDAEVAEVLDHRRADVGDVGQAPGLARVRSEEHTSELQSLMRNSYAVFCLKKKKTPKKHSRKQSHYVIPYLNKINYIT